MESEIGEKLIGFLLQPNSPFRTSASQVYQASSILNWAGRMLSEIFLLISETDNHKANHTCGSRYTSPSNVYEIREGRCTLVRVTQNHRNSVCQFNS